MYSTTHNQYDTNTYNTCEVSPAQLAFRVEVTTATDGWCVGVSSLSSCSPLQDIARGDLLEKSSLLCGDVHKTQFRCYDNALAHVAEVFAAYGSAILGESVSTPELGLVDRLLERTGCLSVNSIETEVYSTFIDVGISTSNMEEPADIVAIYDIHSNSWHGD